MAVMSGKWVDISDRGLMYHRRHSREGLLTGDMTPRNVCCSGSSSGGGGSRRVAKKSRKKVGIGTLSASLLANRTGPPPSSTTLRTQQVFSSPALLLGLLTVLSPLTSRPVEASICESIRIPQCLSLSYNLTQMPNLLYHSNQINANLVFEQFVPLLNTSCSSNLLFYLCSMFVPMCPMGFQQDVIPPCRGVCESSRVGCEPVLQRYNLTWPHELACDELPTYDRGVCISPESIVVGSVEEGKNIPVTTHAPSMHHKRKRCKCEKKEEEKVRNLYTNKKKYTYAIRATFKSGRGIKGGPLVLTVRVRHVMRRGKVPIPKGSEVTLWSPWGCVCHRLLAGKDYLFLGRENTEHKRLRFDDKSRAVQWDKKLRERIKSWDKKIAKKDKRAAEKEKGRKKGKGDKTKTDNAKSKTDRDPAERERRREARKRRKELKERKKQMEELDQEP